MVLLRESRQALPGCLGRLLLGWPRPCRARLPGKGGFSPGGILLLWLDLGPLDLHVGPLMILVSCNLAWPGAIILFPCLCTVWATDLGFVAPTKRWATVLMAQSRRSLPSNVVPFANAGSMKYTLSLFLLCAFNPLRGIKCS